MTGDECRLGLTRQEQIELYCIYTQGKEESEDNKGGVDNQRGGRDTKAGRLVT